MRPVPLKIPVRSYKGKNEKKKQAYFDKIEMAKKIENYINKEMENKKQQTFISGFVAHAIGLPEDIVGDLIEAADAGSNGITVYNPNFSEKD